MAARRAKTSRSTRVSNRDRRLGPWFRLLADIETGRDEPEPYKLSTPPVADSTIAPTVGTTCASSATHRLNR